MSRHRILIVKETHRGLLYEDGVLREVLTAGRHRVRKARSPFLGFFGSSAPRVEVVLVDIRSRDRTILVQNLLTADGATISASFVLHYRVADARLAIHEVKNFEERVHDEAQAAARRLLRGMTFEEVMASRDEIGEELHRLVRESSAAYGLEVSSVDFKDLILPDEFRRALNRAAFAKRFGSTEAVEADESFDFEAEGSFSMTDPRDPTLEEPEVVLARKRFEDRTEPRKLGPMILPHARESRSTGPNPGESETLRRFRS